MDTYLGMVIAVAFDFAPRGFMLCQGQLLPIQRYAALYALIGTRFGGDGTTNFALPDLRGRTPAGTSNGAPFEAPFNGLSNPAIPQDAPGVSYCICVEGMFPSRP